MPEGQGTGREQRGALYCSRELWPGRGARWGRCWCKIGLNLAAPGCAVWVVCSVGKVIGFSREVSACSTPKGAQRKELSVLWEPQSKCPAHEPSELRTYLKLVLVPYQLLMELSVEYNIALTR